MQKSPAILLAFANSYQHPLPALEAEYSEVSGLLQAVNASYNFEIIQEAFATPQKLSQLLARHRDRLVMVHYSGHAGQHRLIAADQSVFAKGLARLFGMMPNLQCVFLNGCSTGGQVRLLLEAGVRSVIATAAPVEDDTAKTFAINFYTELAKGNSLEAAFEMAKTQLEMSRQDIRMHAQHRGVADLESDDPLWGFFKNPERPITTGWNLAFAAENISMPEFQPNLLLIDTILNAVAGFDEEVYQIVQREKNNEKVSLGKKRAKILSCFPLPISEHLQKLIAPNADQQALGFDTVSMERLEQLCNLYLALMDLTVFTMLSQLFLCRVSDAAFNINEGAIEVLQAFFKAPPRTNSDFCYVDFLRSVRMIFDENEVQYFVEEIETMKKFTAPDTEFYEACRSIEHLRKRLQNHQIPGAAIPGLCRESEEKLSRIFSYLGFIANYKLIAVEITDVLKNWRYPEPEFQYTLSNQVFGGAEDDNRESSHILDNRAVVLEKKKGTQAFSYLNLSPFLLDKKAFSKDAFQKSQIYFFWNYVAHSDRYHFKYIRKPDDAAFLEISDEKYTIIKEQLDEFATQVFGLPMQAVVMS